MRIVGRSQKNSDENANDMKFKILTGSLRRQKRSDDLTTSKAIHRIPPTRSIVIANHEALWVVNRVGGGALAWLCLGIR